MNFIVFTILSSLMCFLSLSAEIFKINQIEQVVQQDIQQDTLVLFNIAEVLMDTETSLGTQAWRKYIRSRVDAQLHDELTLEVFKCVPPKTPEVFTAKVIASLQDKGFPVLAFTSRGRHEWYSSQIADIDLLTEKLLQQIGIDFSRTRLPFDMASLNSVFDNYYHAGIIYATNAYEKGEMLVKFTQATHYQPSNIIFVDDKIDSLQTVEEAAKQLGIPFTGYAYSRTSKDHAKFDPMIAHIQLDWLISYNQILSDQEAEQIKKDQFMDVNSEDYFFTLMEKWKSRKAIY